MRPCDDDEAPIVASLLTYYTKWPGPILWKETLKDSRPRAGELAVTGGPQSVVVPFQKRKSFANFVFGFPADRQVGVACLTRILRRRIASSAAAIPASMSPMMKCTTPKLFSADANSSGGAPGTDRRIRTASSPFRLADSISVASTRCASASVESDRPRNTASSARSAQLSARLAICTASTPRLAIARPAEH